MLMAMARYMLMSMLMPLMQRQIRMRGINPPHTLRPLSRHQVRQIHRDSLAITAHEHTLQHLVRLRIDLLMRHIRRHKDEIPRPRLRHKLQLRAPPHPRPPLHHVDHRFQMSVVMRPGLCVCGDSDRAGPELLRPHARGVDCGGACHACSGVCAVFSSRLSPGMTFTPVCFQWSLGAGVSGTAAAAAGPSGMESAMLCEESGSRISSGF